MTSCVPCCGGGPGNRLPDEAREVLARLAEELSDGGRLRARLRSLLAADELDRTRERAVTLLGSGRYPRPARGRPAIPWPAF